MGVSRKLAPLGRGENSISDVGFQWSSQRYSLEELSARFRLPVVVQCVVESCQVLTSTFTFDLSQPLVLHSSRCRRKIKARSLAQPRNFHPPADVGPPLVIPEDYDGWFAAGGNGAKPPCHAKVAELAEVAASRVLVARRHLALVQIGSAAGVTYSERHLEPGEVLAIMGQCKGELALPANSPFRRSRRFLRCVDERGDSILLCMHQRGAFYQVAPRVARDDTTAVVSPKQLIASRDQFPLQVRHVMGEPPMVLRNSFPCLLRLDSVFSERSMLAAPLVASRSRPRPLEVAVRSRLLFRMALNHGQLLRTREGARALEACGSGGGAYFSAIKVAFTLRPEVSPLDDLDLSLYETSPRKQRAAARDEHHVSRTLPLERHSNEPPDSPRGEKGEGDRLEGQRQDLKPMGRPTTQRAREYHGEPLTDSESDSDGGLTVNGDDDDDQASAACDVDAQSEFEIDWEPERLEGRNSSSPIDGSLAGDSGDGGGEQAVTAETANTVLETSTIILDQSKARQCNTAPQDCRDSADHSLSDHVKEHQQFQITFENDRTHMDYDAHDDTQEGRDMLGEEQAEEEEQEKEQEVEHEVEHEEEHEEEQEEDQEEEAAEEEQEKEEEKHEEEQEAEEEQEEEEEEEILEGGDDEEVVLDKVLSSLETLDFNDDDDFLQQQEEQREQEVMKERVEVMEEDEMEVMIEEVLVTVVNKKEAPEVEEDEEEDLRQLQRQDDDDDDDGQRCQEHRQGQDAHRSRERDDDSDDDDLGQQCQEHGQRREAHRYRESNDNDDDNDDGQQCQGHRLGLDAKGSRERILEAQWKTLWIQASGIPPLPKPRPPRRPSLPPRHLPTAPEQDMPPPLPPRAPHSPVVTPRTPQILDILVLNGSFTTPVDV